MDVLKSSTQLYRLLLRLYPAGFRREYELLMAQAFRDQCRVLGQRGTLGWMALWWRTLADVVRTAAIEHLAAKKGVFMESARFKNHPGRAASLFFLLPGIALSLYYIVTISNGESEGYFLAALAGVAGFGLAWLKIIPQARPWGQFALGFVIGAVSLLVMIIWTPMANLGFLALREPPWPEVRLVVAGVMCLLIIGLLGRWLEAPFRRIYWIVAGVLLVNGVVWAFLPIGPNQYIWWDLAWTWGYSTAILGAVVLSIKLVRRAGIQVLLTALVALGILVSVNLTAEDVAQGSTTYGQLLLLVAYLFPLVICPAWLLFAPTWQAKKRGVLLSWSAMVVGIVVILPILDIFFVPHYFRYPVIVPLPSAFAYVPVLIGLWLAFALYEKTLLQPGSPANTPDSPPGNAPQPIRMES